MIWRMQRSLEQNAELQWETKLSNFGVLFRLFFYYINFFFLFQARYGSSASVRRPGRGCQCPQELHRHRGGVVWRGNQRLRRYRWGLQGTIRRRHVRRQVPDDNDELPVPSQRIQARISKFMFLAKQSTTINEITASPLAMSPHFLCGLFTGKVCARK